LQTGISYDSILILNTLVCSTNSFTVYWTLLFVVIYL